MSAESFDSLTVGDIARQTVPHFHRRDPVRLKVQSLAVARRVLGTSRPQQLSAGDQWGTEALCVEVCLKVGRIGAKWGTWAGHNNLHLNRVKSVELIVSAHRRRRQFNPPPCIPEIKRVTTLTILGVTITNKLSVGEHVRTVVNSCAQIMHAHTYTAKSRDG